MWPAQPPGHGDSPDPSMSAEDAKRNGHADNTLAGTNSDYEGSAKPDTVDSSEPNPVSHTTDKGSTVESDRGRDEFTKMTT